MTDTIPTAKATTTEPARERPRQSLRTYFALAILLLLVVAAFHELLLWMMQQWWRDAHYSHGFLIPLLSGYLIYRQLPRLRELPVEHPGWGLLLMLAGALLHVGPCFTACISPPALP